MYDNFKQMQELVRNLRQNVDLEGLRKQAKAIQSDPGLQRAIENTQELRK